MPEDLTCYFAGEKLYGDDFSPDQIEAWFKDEAEGYANLGSKNRNAYRYAYHQLNIHHGYSHLGSRRFERALGLGSAYGDEFFPIIDRIGHLAILDPSDAFSATRDVKGVPCEYRKPNMDGSMSFPDGCFDLIVALGVLHHVPNVSRVMSECARCLSKNGIMLVREPIVSMGDWRKPRPGGTKRERGIPLKIFERIIEDCGFHVRREALCSFPAMAGLASRIGIAAHNSVPMVWLDSLLSRLFSWNVTYHRTTFVAKLAPASAFFVLEKK